MKIFVKPLFNFALTSRCTYKKYLCLFLSNVLCVFNRLFRLVPCLKCERSCCSCNCWLLPLSTRQPNENSRYDLMKLSCFPIDTQFIACTLPRGMQLYWPSRSGESNSDQVEININDAATCVFVLIMRLIQFLNYNLLNMRGHACPLDVSPYASALTSCLLIMQHLIDVSQVSRLVICMHVVACVPKAASAFTSNVICSQVHKENSCSDFSALSFVFCIPL